MPQIQHCSRCNSTAVYQSFQHGGNTYRLCKRCYDLCGHMNNEEFGIEVSIWRYHDNNIDMNKRMVDIE